MSEPISRRASRKARVLARLHELRANLEHLSSDVQSNTSEPEPSAQEEQVSEQVVRGLPEEAPAGGEGETEVENLAHEETKPTAKRKRSPAKRSAK